VAVSYLETGAIGFTPTPSPSLIPEPGAGMLRAVAVMIFRNRQYRF
jgi:hypothetical protein